MVISKFCIIFIVIILSCDAKRRRRIVPYVNSDTTDIGLQNINIVLANQKQQGQLHQINKNKKEDEQKLQETIENLIKRIKDLKQDERQTMMNMATEIMVIQLSLLVTANTEKKAEDWDNKELIRHAWDIKRKAVEIISTGRSKFSHLEFVSKLTVLMQQALAIDKQITMQELNKITA